MSSSSSRTRATTSEGESSLLTAIQRIYHDYEHGPMSTEKLQKLSSQLYQGWMSLPTRSIHEQGYQIIAYLEHLLVHGSLMNEQFFILITSTLAKHTKFFHSLLMDHQRFKPLFAASTKKPIYVLRYIELLYFYCPSESTSTIGLQFYRFVLDSYLLPCLRRIQRDLDWLAAFSTLLHHFYENTTKNVSSLKAIECIFTDPKDATDYCIVVIDTLLHHSLPAKTVKDLEYDVKLIDTLSKVIAAVWEQSPVADTLQLRSIEYLFLEMSTKNLPRTHVSMCFSSSKTTFGAAILAVFSCIQFDAAEITLKSMFADGRLNGERLATLITYLLELIDAPGEFIQPMSYETWISGFCTGLITFNQRDCLLALIDETTSFLVERLFHVQTCDNALQVLFWFIRYDKRIKTFLLLLDRLPPLLERIKTFPDEEDLRTKLIDLCYMALAIHPDYDLANERVLRDIIQHLPQPDLNVLTSHRAMHARLHSMASDHEMNSKNRVGIVNLGNTCYANSVLQALYQCDLFRKYILEQRFDDQRILRELQIIFAQLNLSKRPCINAANLLKMARPAWFTGNEQQDCAEFLGYLLDTIKDEEKKVSACEIERLFTIRTRQINRCHRCSVESNREESSNYLFLPIPTDGHRHETMDYNQSATPMTLMRSGLKFYAAANGNSVSDDQTQSRSPPPSYNSATNETRGLDLQVAFDSYFQNEQLKDDNQYRCEHCRSLQDADRHIVLQTAPAYLILCLNRFEYDKETNVFRKVFTKMNYPKMLNVRIHSVITKYCLVLVIVHTGYTLHGGHYYVYARETKASVSKATSEECFGNDEWFLMNDDLVTLSSYEALIENCAQYTSATPYVLFYKRMEDMERSKEIRVHDSLVDRINEDNRMYRAERER